MNSFWFWIGLLCFLFNLWSFVVSGSLFSLALAGLMGWVTWENWKGWKR